MFKNRCYNGGNKHKFVPRYTEKESNLHEKLCSNGGSIQGPNLREFIVINVYIYDICKWCGKIVKNK